MNEFDDYDERRDMNRSPWATLVAFIIGMSFIAVVAYVLLIKPDSIGNMIDAANMRNSYEDLLSKKQARIAELESILEQERATHKKEMDTRLKNLEDYEAQWTTEKANADNYKALYETEAKKRKALEETSTSIEQYKAEQEKVLHLSIGGLASNPIDSLSPRIDFFAGAGMKQWRILAGAGIGLDAVPSVSLGFEWNFR